MNEEKYKAVQKDIVGDEIHHSGGSNAGSGFDEEEEKSKSRDSIDIHELI